MSTERVVTGSTWRNIKTGEVVLLACMYGQGWDTNVALSGHRAGRGRLGDDSNPSYDDIYKSGPWEQVTLIAEAVDGSGAYRLGPDE